LCIAFEKTGFGYILVDFFHNRIWSIFGQFWSFFGQFLVNFWSIFGQFLVDFFSQTHLVTLAPKLASILSALLYKKGFMVEG
jgi:hypothetical protein